MNHPNDARVCLVVFTAFFMVTLAGCELSEVGIPGPAPDDAHAPDARPLVELDGRIVIPVLEAGTPGDESPEGPDGSVTPVPDGGGDIVVTELDAGVHDAAVDPPKDATRAEDSSRTFDAGPELCKGYAPPDLPAFCEASRVRDASPTAASAVTGATPTPITATRTRRAGAASRCLGSPALVREAFFRAMGVSTSREGAFVSPLGFTIRRQGASTWSGGTSSDLWDESSRRCLRSFDRWEVVPGLWELPSGLRRPPAAVRGLPSDRWERASGLREPSDEGRSAMSVAVLAPSGNEGAPIGQFRATTREVLDAIGPMLDAIVDLEATIEAMVTPRRPLKEATGLESNRSRRMEKNRGRV
jgi:hypothetical protein